MSGEKKASSEQVVSHPTTGMEETSGNLTSSWQLSGQAPSKALHWKEKAELNHSVLPSYTLPFGAAQPKRPVKSPANSLAF